MDMKEQHELQVRLDAIQHELNDIRARLSMTTGETGATPPAGAPRTRKPKREWAITRYVKTRLKPEFEEIVAGNLLGKLGLLTLILATAWFVKYAFDNRWINESGRIYTGLLIGYAVIAGGLQLARGRLRLAALAVIGTGFAIHYIAVFGAYYFYDLLGRNETFIMLFVQSSIIALFAARANSQLLYVFSILGAFLAPVLVSRGENSYRFLLGYIALVNVIFFAISCKRHWRAAAFIVFSANALVYTLWASGKLAESSFTVPFVFLLFIFLLAMARQLVVIPRIFGALGPADYAVVPLAIVFFLALGAWACNVFHEQLRPHFVLATAGLLMLFYTIFTRQEERA